jgi:hypothetical protein
MRAPKRSSPRWQWIAIALLALSRTTVRSWPVFLGGLFTRACFEKSVICSLSKGVSRGLDPAVYRELHDKGQPAIVYEVIAKRIIDAAKNGERDPVQLRNIGLAGLGFDKGDK